MALRLIEVITTSEITDSLIDELKQLGNIDSWQLQHPGSDQHQLKILLSSDLSQKALELLQTNLGTTKETRIIVLAPQAALPVLEEAQPATDEDKQKKHLIGGISKEEIYNSVVDNAKITKNYILLTFLAALVATIGIVRNNVTILIGAMLIAPLLGPNLALALGTTLGKTKLIFKAARAILTGIAVVIVSAFLLEVLIHYLNLGPVEHMQVEIGYGTIILALAAGTAAVIALISGLSSNLVGVMVAVALLPPAAMIGVRLSYPDYPAALTSALLLAINIVCINLSATLVFLIKGIRPNFWYEQQQAKKVQFWFFTFWMIALIILVLIVFQYYKMVI